MKPCNSADIHAPMWSLEIDSPANRSEAQTEVSSLHRMGIRQIIIRPSNNALSGDWLGAFGGYLEEARAREMGVWIHHSIRDIARSNIDLTSNPEAAAKSIDIQVIRKDTADSLIVSPGHFLIGSHLEGGRVMRTKELPDAASISALSNDWLIFDCHIKEDFTAADILSESGVDWIIKNCLEPYKDQYEADFGKTICGVYAPELGLELPVSTTTSLSLPYNETLLGDEGSIAIADLPYLFHLGDRSSSVRTRFWGRISELMHRNYHSALRRWCDETGLLFSGLIESEDDRGTFYGNPFRTADALDIPGAEVTEDSIVSCRIATSSAQGKVIYTGNEDLQHDIAFACGANTPVMSSGDESAIEQAGKLSDILSQGTRQPRILVLYPLSGRYASYQPDRKTSEIESIDNALDSLLFEMSSMQMDYDLIDTEGLLNAETSDKTIHIGDRNYTTLLVAYTPYMEHAEYDAVQRVSKDVETYVFYRTMDSHPDNTPRSSGGLNFVATGDVETFIVRLRHTIDDGIHLIGKDRKDIFLLRRVIDGHNLAFLVNRSQEPKTVTTRFSGASTPVVIDPMSGAATELQAKVSDGKSEVIINFEPHQSVVVTYGTKS